MTYYHPNHPNLLKYQTITNEGTIAIISNTMNEVKGPRNSGVPVTMPPGKLTFIP